MNPNHAILIQYPMDRIANSFVVVTSQLHKVLAMVSPCWPIVLVGHLRTLFMITITLLTRIFRWWFISTTRFWDMRHPYRFYLMNFSINFWILDTDKNLLVTTVMLDLLISKTTKQPKLLLRKTHMITRWIESPDVFSIKSIPIFNHVWLLCQAMLFNASVFAMQFKTMLCIWYANFIIVTTSQHDKTIT